MRLTPPPVCVCPSPKGAVPEGLLPTGLVLFVAVLGLNPPDDGYVGKGVPTVDTTVVGAAVVEIVGGGVCAGEGMAPVTPVP